MSRTRNSIPDNFIGLAERAQVLDDNIITRYPFRAVRWVLNGSKSDALVWVRYNTIDDERPDEEQGWLESKPDPAAGTLTRLKRSATVLGASAIAMTDLTVRLKALSLDPQPAVAYKYAGVIHGGILPNGFGRYFDSQTHELLDAAAMRPGREPMLAKIGQMTAGEDGLTLWTPYGVRIIEDMVPAIELGTSYPGVPLA